MRSDWLGKRQVEVSEGMTDTHAEASFTQTPTGALTFNLCCNAGEVDICISTSELQMALPTFLISYYNCIVILA